VRNVASKPTKSFDVLGWAINPLLCKTLGILQMFMYNTVCYISEHVKWQSCWTSCNSSFTTVE